MFAQITIIGNLGQNPELRHTPSGIPVCNFSVAVNRTWTDGNEEQQETVTWYRVKVWRRQAEACHENLKKGSKVLIVSEIIEVNPWLDADGTPRATIEVTPRTVRFLSGRQDNGEVSEAEGEPAHGDENPFF